MLKPIVCIVALAAAMLTFAGCDSPMYGRAENATITHLQFGSSDLQDNTRVEPVIATRDPAGLLHLQINIRNTSSSDLYVDCFATFTRNGQVVEKIGPQTAVLRANLPDTITMNSTQPADDYFVSLTDAK